MTESPWTKNYAPGVPATVDIPDHSLVDLLDASVERFGGHVALDFYGGTTTYAELGSRSPRQPGAPRPGRAGR